jgi:hypothetical protein
VPVEAKPIFRPDVVRLPLLGFSLPEQVAQRREKLKKWAEIISSGSVDAHKVQEILGDFINDVFCELLGYTRAVDNLKRYTISREKHVQVDGKFADAVLGEFGPEGKRYVAAVAGKGPKDPLDRPFGGRRVSAVHQAFFLIGAVPQASRAPSRAWRPAWPGAQEGSAERLGRASFVS